MKKDILTKHIDLFKKNLPNKIKIQKSKYNADLIHVDMNEHNTNKNNKYYILVSVKKSNNNKTKTLYVDFNKTRFNIFDKGWEFTSSQTIYEAPGFSMINDSFDYIKIIEAIYTITNLLEELTE